LPVEVVERAKAHLLYNLACGMADGGASEPACNAIRDLRPPEATLVGRGDRVPAEAAAFANGAIIHARAQDDTHFPSQCHLGAAVIPAALAVAEREARTGRDTLAAIIGGYEVAAVVGEPLVDEVVSRGFRASSVFGTLGAATAAASLLRLDEAGTAGAIANGASLAAGLTETWLSGSSEWVWQLGAAARNGVLAARLAAEGAHGAPSALEGEAGLATAFSDRELWTSPSDWALGERWRTLEVIYKPYPVCNICQVPVILASGLAERHDMGPEDVDAVRCSLNPADRAYPGTLNRGPFRDIAATLMSAPYCVAMAIKHRSATLSTLRDFDDPAIAALIERTAINADEALPPLAARIDVKTRDGRRYMEELVPDESTFQAGWEPAVAASKRLRPEMGDRGTRLHELEALVSQFEDLPSVSAVMEATVGLSGTSAEHSNRAAGVSSRARMAPTTRDRFGR
jgi:2-methylcitrate dehydratase PrpD